MIKLMLIGHQRAGKDTVAGYLYEQYGFTPFRLAQGIYEIAKNYFHMKEKDRQLLIDIGEKMREIDPLVWIKHTLNEVEAFIQDTQLLTGSNPQGIVITDVRMKHEFEVLKDAGFIPVYVYAKLKTRAGRPGYTPKHENDPTEPKEEEFMKLCYKTLDNNGSIWELYDQIDDLMKELELLEEI